MARELVLTLDVGTGSVRSCIYSIAKNEVVAVASRSCSIEHPGPFLAEWEPDKWRAAVLGTIADAVRQARQPAEAYVGITVASLRQGFVLLDKNREPVARGVLNYDRRGADYIPWIERVMPIDRLYALTGHWHAPELTLPKLLWFQHRCPNVWARVRHFLFVHDWVLLLLTGRCATAASLTTAGQMGDCTARTWAVDLLTSLGVPVDILPNVMEGGSLLGGLLPAVAAHVGLESGLPVYVGGGDTQFGSLGTGGMVPGVAVIVGGSTTPIMMTTDRPLFDPLRRPWVSPHAMEGLWAVETNAGHTGMIYRWFRDTFGQAQVVRAVAQGRDSYALLDDLADASPIGANGLLIVAANPRWSQETWQQKAPYIFFNFRVSHTVGDVARAIMEGVCFGVRGNLDELERVAGQPFSRVVFTGGSSHAPVWAQMMADVTGRPLVVPHVPEPAAVAGAMLVQRSVGESAPVRSPVADHYLPDEERTKAYEPLYHRYLEVFQHMQRDFAEA